MTSILVHAHAPSPPTALRAVLSVQQLAHGTRTYGCAGSDASICINACVSTAESMQAASCCMQLPGRPAAAGRRRPSHRPDRSIGRDIECMPAHALPTAAAGCPYDTSRVVCSARSSRQLQPYVTSTCREQFS